MIQFDKENIYETIGIVLDSSRKCNKSIRAKGIRYQFICKIYDKHANMTSQYTTTQKGIFKEITKEMYRIGEGSIEYLCHPHPKIR